jgi:Nuclease-related domain
MRNLVTARALARRSRNLLLLSILVFLAGVLTITIGLFMRSIPLVVPSNPNYDFYITVREILVWLGGGIIIIAALMILRALTWKRENLIATQIGQILAQDLNLDDRYAYIPNLSRRTIGYVDAVLVGPPGVLVFRISERGGTFFNEGSVWMKQRDKGDWQALRWSPTREVVEDVNKIREFLQTRNISEIPVFPVIIFTEDQPETRITLEKPTVPVMQPPELSYGLSNSYFGKRDRIDQLTANKVTDTLLG